ncbi:Aste57867_5902 [Aphanomyces stellatus]|uniref:Aste57867_5902 protein n=1 Tax=Aphanomyces stellatus TaxID=120398 RepID=A0A485KGZ2_9STRA|nr:hypothetical protein As57867_005888 [Aphanomyces stellatus]VFT82923.1 Aste57867_5902 [Aphanomyces stellatus]
MKIVRPSSTTMTMLAAAAWTTTLASAKPICSALTPYSLTNAAQQYPELAPAVAAMQDIAVASWYTDRWTNQISDLLAKCHDAIPSIVIYGLPDKDCGDGGFSQGGDNKNTNDYHVWLTKLTAQVGTREVIYVLEPDAVGLIAGGGCGVQKGYMANLKMAVKMLSENSQAHIYVDVASWADQAGAIQVVNELKGAGNLKGVAINTSNYRGTSELNALCQTYSSATGGLHCVFDVSRNFNGSPQNEWCNAKSAGIGALTTAETGNPLVDYHLWIKVPGESDGECTGRGPDAAVGPPAGSFFYDGFKSMWNQGYYVKEKGLPEIGGSWPAPSSNAPPTPTSSDDDQYPTSAAPPSPPSDGQVEIYGQCGGNNYNGPTACQDDLHCQVWNEWYHQCIPEEEYSRVKKAVVCPRMLPSRPLR